MSDLNGTVLWYRPTMGRGLVKADTGKRFFFSGADAVDAVAGLRIAFRVEPPSGGGPVEATGLGLEGGVRTVLDPVEYLPQPKVKVKKRAPAKKKQGSAAKRPSKKKVPAKPKKAPGAAMAAGTPVEYLPQPKVKKRAPAKKKQGSAAKRPSKKKVPAKPKKAPGAAMAAGTPVSHADFGAGHVVSSTKTLVRVEFLNGEERSLPVAEIEDVSGQRGTPAPTRRKRAPPAAPSKPAGRSHVTRKKSDDA